MFRKEADRNRAAGAIFLDRKYGTCLRDCVPEFFYCKASLFWYVNAGVEMRHLRRNLPILLI